MMFIQGDRVDSIASKNLPPKDLSIRQQKKVKEFLVKRRGYKRPDFNRMILDLCRLKWTRENFFVLLFLAPQLSQNGHVAVHQILKMEGSYRTLES
jgi:hypothetical protein